MLEADDLMTERIGLRASFRHRDVERAVRRAPVLGEGVGVLAEHAHERLVPTESQRGAVNIDYGAIAPASTDISPERLAVPVREVAWIGRDLVNRRELVPEHRVTHPHRGEWAFATE